MGEKSNSLHHIKQISVSKLFGRYTYDIPKEGASLEELNILYGENGLGKTTLLNIIFHLLSPLKSRNHHTTISSIPFESISVVLNDNTIIQAKKNEQILIGPVTFSFSRDSDSIVWTYFPNSQQQLRFEDIPDEVDIKALPDSLRDEVVRALAQRRYYNALEKLEVKIFMLTSDRILLGDSIEGGSGGGRGRTNEDVRQSSRSRLLEFVSEQRNAAVAVAFASASGWLQKKFVERSYGAAESAGRVYEKVINRIADTPYKTSSGLSQAQQEKNRDSLRTRIANVNAKAKEFSQFGLASQVISANVLQKVSNTSGNKFDLLNNVLSAQLDDLEARQESVEPFYKLVSSFIANVNKFLRDKKLIYSLNAGLQIVSTEEKSVELQASQLSSGEQQLILITCHVLTARDQPNIFIIDEPEISLNILWQRMLVDSLREVAGESGTQFLLASHSMEILAKHRARVVALAEVA